MSELTWTNDKRKLSDLVPWPQNPRQIREEDARRLAESLEEFGQVQTIAIQPDNEIIDGHQRQHVWAAAQKFGPDYVVDVRIPSRPLTERERQKLAVYLHQGAVGEWDFDELANWDVDVSDLLAWGFKQEQLGIVEPLDFSDFDAELEQLDGYEEVDIHITVPAMHEEAVIDWLANGESKTAPGLGKGVLRRCGLL